jgi:ribonuclease BN (tRNA processing enzyme)
MLKVVVLDSGAALPSPGQGNSSYLVRTDTATLLVDCGPAVLQLLHQVDLTPGDVTHLYFTHRHGDHVLGFPMFLLWWFLNKEPGSPLPLVVAGQVTWGTLEMSVQHTFGDLARRLTEVPRRVLPDTEASVFLLTEGLTLRTWPLVHSPFAPVLGVRLEIGSQAIAFTGDTAPCDNILPLARGADLLLHEATYCATLNPEYPEGLHGHSTARAAGKSAAAAGVKRLGLVHISPEYAGRHEVLIAEAQREFTGEVTAPGAGFV